MAGGKDRAFVVTTAGGDLRVRGGAIFECE